LALIMQSGKVDETTNHSLAPWTNRLEYCK
jgi:hypothetical protein